MLWPAQGPLMSSLSCVCVSYLSKRLYLSISLPFQLGSYETLNLRVTLQGNQQFGGQEKKSQTVESAYAKHSAD